MLEGIPMVLELLVQGVQWWREFPMVVRKTGLLCKTDKIWQTVLCQNQLGATDKVGKLYFAKSQAIR